VTELLINALKHAFPSGEKGDILGGLGTSIVEVLAHQLKATVQKQSGPQGSTVTITASAVAAEQE
jgi:two-component sensor histidine kinase